MPHFGGRQAKSAAEHPVEIGEVVETRFVGDIADSPMIEAPA
jgi:hypothetical protein